MLTVADWAPVRLCSNFSRKNIPVHIIAELRLNFTEMSVWNKLRYISCME